MSNIGERWQQRISKRPSKPGQARHTSTSEHDSHGQPQHHTQNNHHARSHHSHGGHNHGHSHDGHEHPNYKSFNTYRAEVRRVLSITLVLNVFVVLLKLIVGSWTGSLSLIADALHSITDSANNVLGLVTNQLASPVPDRDHPYGHQKYEAVGALGIAAFLGIACFEILRGAGEHLIFGGDPVTMSALSLWFLLAVLGSNIFVAFYERRVGNRLGSNILIADAEHTMSDIWITIAVLGGLIGVWLGVQWLDLVLAFPVALLVIRSGWVVLSANLPWLVDEMAIAPEAIHAAVIQVPGVLNCHNIASRGLLGRQVFIDMHLIVEPQDVLTAHDITEQVEQQLEEEFGPARVTIHIEPHSYLEREISFGPGHHN
ncbi:MAG: cation diffusion facilitator family transporter [Cyanobacteria bacterium P01_F01_bin.53]